MSRILLISHFTFWSSKECLNLWRCRDAVDPILIYFLSLISHRWQTNDLSSNTLIDQWNRTSKRAFTGLWFVHQLISCCPLWARPSSGNRTRDSLLWVPNVWSICCHIHCRFNSDLSRGCVGVRLKASKGECHSFEWYEISDSEIERLFDSLRSHNSVVSVYPLRARTRRTCPTQTISSVIKRDVVIIIIPGCTLSKTGSLWLQLHNMVLFIMPTNNSKMKAK